MNKNISTLNSTVCSYALLSTILLILGYNVFITLKLSWTSHNSINQRIRPSTWGNEWIVLTIKIQTILKK